MLGARRGKSNCTLCPGHGELVHSPQSNLIPVDTQCKLGAGSGSVAAGLIHLSPSSVDASSGMDGYQLSLDAEGHVLLLPILACQSIDKVKQLAASASAQLVLL